MKKVVKWINKEKLSKPNDTMSFEEFEKHIKEIYIRTCFDVGVLENTPQWFLITIESSYKHKKLKLTSCITNKFIWATGEINVKGGTLQKCFKKMITDIEHLENIF